MALWVPVLIVSAIVIWIFAGGFAPFIAQRIDCEVFGKGASERGQLGDQFGMVNALFTGLAFAGVVLSVMLQRHDAKIRENEVKQTLYTARLSTLVEHYRLFREHPHYQRARSLAWACTQKALREPPFRDYLASSHSLVHLTSDNQDQGYLCHKDTLNRTNVSADGTNASAGGTEPDKDVLTWNQATHFVDDLISFFSVLSLHIKAIEDLKLTPDDLANFKRVVRQMNIYWDWWGPVVQYIECIRQKKDKAPNVPEWCISAPDHREEFDRIDTYMFSGDFSTRMPDDWRKSPYVAIEVQTPEALAQRAKCDAARKQADQLLALLIKLNAREITWADCTSDGKELTQAQRDAKVHEAKVRAAIMGDKPPAAGDTNSNGELTYVSIGVWEKKTEQ